MWIVDYESQQFWLLFKSEDSETTTSMEFTVNLSGVFYPRSLKDWNIEFLYGFISKCLRAVQFTQSILLYFFVYCALFRLLLSISTDRVQQLFQIKKPALILVQWNNVSSEQSFPCVEVPLVRVTGGSGIKLLWCETMVKTL